MLLFFYLLPFSLYPVKPSKMQHSVQYHFCVVKTSPALNILSHFCVALLKKKWLNNQIGKNNFKNLSREKIVKGKEKTWKKVWRGWKTC